MENLIEKEKWYKNKYTIIFLSIFVIAIAIRLYYFSITYSQTSWWDSSEYLSTAKAYAGIMDYDLSGQRLPGYPLFISLFFKLGIQNELILGFLVNFLPSIIMLILIYLVIKKMYPDKRIALISVAIMAVLWESLFYSNRFQTENFGMIFQMLSLLFVYKFIEKKKILSLILTGLFIIISILFRPGQMLIVPAIVLFLAISQWKDHKAIVISSIAMMLIAAAGIMMFVPSLNYIIMSNFNASHIGPSWNSLTVFEGFLSPLLNIFFYIGLIVSLFTLTKKKDEEKRSDILNLLFIFTVLAAFIFIIRAPAFEYRWFFPFISGMLVLTSKGIIDVCDGIKAVFKGKTGRVVSVIGIIFILGIGLWGQLSHANIIINQKVDTYKPVKEAGMWIKENSAMSEVIFSISKPQTAYYSERKVMSYSIVNNSAQMDDYVRQNWPRYITVSLFEPHPEWIGEWIMLHSELTNDTYPIIVTPMAGWFFDDAQQQPSLLIYDVRIYGLQKGEQDSCGVTEDTCAV